MPIHGMPTSLPSLPYRWGRGVARRGLCLSGMQRKQAAAELGAGAVHHGRDCTVPVEWRRRGPGRRDAMPQAGTDSEPLGDDPDVLRRRIRELESGERVDAGGGSGP